MSKIVPIIGCVIFILSIATCPSVIKSQNVLENTSEKDERSEFKFEIDDKTYLIEKHPFPNRAGRIIASHPSARHHDGKYLIYFENGLYFFDGLTYEKHSGPSKKINHRTPHLFSISDNKVLLTQFSKDSLGIKHRFEFIDFLTDSPPEPPFPYEIDELLEKTIRHISQFHSKDLLIHTRENNLFLLQNNSIDKLEIEGLHFATAFEDYIATIHTGIDGISNAEIRSKSGEVLWSSPPLEADLSDPNSMFRWVGNHLYLLQPTNTEYTIHSIPLDKNLYSEHSQWKSINIDKSKMNSFVSSGDKLIFASVSDQTYYEVSGNEIKVSDYFTMLARKLSPTIIKHHVESEVHTNKKWFLTSTGMISVRELKEDTQTQIELINYPGVSARGLDFQKDSLLWISSYSGLQLLSVSQKKGPVPIAGLDKACAPEINYDVLFNAPSLININGKGIFSYNFSTRKCTFNKLPVYARAHLFSMDHIFPDIFIGTASGVLRFNPVNKSQPFTKFQLDTQMENFQHLNVNRVKRHGDSDTVFICSTDGLYLTQALPGQSNGGVFLEKILEESVHDAHFLSDGSLFVATQHSGLIWLDSTVNRNPIYTFNDQNHLQSNYTHNIQEDNMGRIWLGTNLGLYLIDLGKQIVYPFGVSNGFPSNEFNRLSSAKTQSGLLAFGGVNGVSVFNPKQFNPSYGRKTVMTTSLLSKDNDSLFIIKPEKPSSEKLHYKVPSLAQRFRPITNLGLFQSELQLYYRNKPSEFWKQAPQNFIPNKRLKTKKLYELMWISPGKTAYHSEIIVSPTLNEHNIPTSYYVFTFIALGLTGFLIRAYNKKSTTKIEAHTEKTEMITTLAKPTEEASNQNENIESASPDTVKQFLIQLEEKENHVYAYSKMVSSKFLSELRSIIESDIGDPKFSVDYAAEKLNMSSRQFHRRVRKHTGLTPIKLFSLFRMKKAKSLILENLDIRVIELAEQVGYNNPSYFSKKFKELYGLSPSEMTERIQDLSAGKK